MGLKFLDGVEAVDDFSMFQGDDAYLEIVIKDVSTKAPIDISTYPNIIWELEGVEFRIEKSLALGSMTRISSSSVRVPLDAAETETLRGKYTHQLRLINAGGAKEIVLNGTGEFNREVFNNTP